MRSLEQKRATHGVTRHGTQSRIRVGIAVTVERRRLAQARGADPSDVFNRDEPQAQPQALSDIRSGCEHSEAVSTVLFYLRAEPRADPVTELATSPHRVQQAAGGPVLLAIQLNG